MNSGIKGWWQQVKLSVQGRGLKTSFVTLIFSIYIYIYIYIQHIYRQQELGEGIEAVGELLKVGEKLEMVDLGLYCDLEGDIQGEEIAFLTRLPNI